RWDSERAIARANPKTPVDWIYGDQGDVLHSPDHDIAIMEIELGNGLVSENWVVPITLVPPLPGDAIHVVGHPGGPPKRLLPNGNLDVTLDSHVSSGRVIDVFPNGRRTGSVGTQALLQRLIYPVA
ncbi:MAG: hypothetical protein JWM76_4413, partial [Pseudonocardiales bacterium]|nr:hypothetical protein [Pseudonocardiales bacterium]